LQVFCTAYSASVLPVKVPVVCTATCAGVVFSVGDWFAGTVSAVAITVAAVIGVAAAIVRDALMGVAAAIVRDALMGVAAAIVSAALMGVAAVIVRDALIAVDGVTAAAAVAATVAKPVLVQLLPLRVYPLGQHSAAIVGALSPVGQENPAP